MVLGKYIICNDVFNCTYVTIKNSRMDGLWENMNNLWVYDPIILISMITLNHGRNTVSKGKTNYFFLFSWNVHWMFIPTIVLEFIVLCHIRQKMSNMSPSRLFVRHRRLLKVQTKDQIHKFVRILFWLFYDASMYEIYEQKFVKVLKKVVWTNKWLGGNIKQLIW